MRETVALKQYSTPVSLLLVSLKTNSWSCSGDVSVSLHSPRVFQMFALTAAVYCQPFFTATPLSAGTKRVHNNIVYNEYISDREHVHMNSTQWETLTDFTKWLGREGKQSLWESFNVYKTLNSFWKRPEISVNHIIIMRLNHNHCYTLSLPGLCKVDETPKGWYVQYIDRDPETIRRQEEQARKKKHDLDDEERSAKFIEEQVRRGRGGKEMDVSTFRMVFSLTHAQFI